MKGITIFYVYVFILAVLIILAPNDRFALIGVTVYSIISTALLACFIESESKELACADREFFKVRILDKHVGLISIYKQGDGLIFISTRSRLQQYQCRLKNHAITHTLFYFYLINAKLCVIIELSVAQSSYTAYQLLFVS